MKRSECKHETDFDFIARINDHNMFACVDCGAVYSIKSKPTPAKDG